MKKKNVKKNKKNCTTKRKCWLNQNYLKNNAINKAKSILLKHMGTADPGD